ncbi:hypothetical protein CAPTEDRAFT_25439, partial [Capitella teleta]
IPAFGIPLNMLCLFVIWRCWKPPTVQKTLLFFVCGNNLVTCFYGLPFTAFDQYHPIDKPANFCTFHAYAYFLLQAYSILVLFMVTLNRYFVIVIPTSKIFTFGGTTRTVIIAFVTLFLQMSILIPPAIGVWGSLGYEHSTGSCVLVSANEGGDSSYNLLGSICAFALPFISMLLCYLHIFFVVRRQNCKVLQGNLFGAGKEQQRRKQELRLLTTTFGMILLFVVTYLP